MKKSQEFIKKYKKLLETGPDFYNVDSCLMKPEEFNARKYKFLLILPTPALTKSVSATVNVINDMFCSEMPDWFFDVAYLPTKKDIELYDKCNVPYCIGQVSHMDASQFNMVGFSISVLHEILTTPTIVKSFSRCEKPIPLTWTERKGMKLGETPLLMCGGITATCGEMMFGELGDGRQSFLDFMCLGLCDTLKWVCEQYQVTKAKTNQDFIEECFKFDFFYHPQAYKVVYKDNLIVENTKINPKAQDFVKPYYPKFIPDRLGVGRTIVQATGTNAGDTQLQLSEGCTGGRGSCNFCHEGNYSGAWVEVGIDRIKRDALNSKKWSAASSCKPLTFNANHMSDFTEVIYTMNELYPKVTYINMRLEELAQDTEAFKMMKFTGASRLSAPIEGLSNRIRNGFMNKNLSMDSIEKLLDFMIGQRVTDIKVGLVWTGYENEEDWKEMRELVSRLKKKAASMNRKLPFRLKCTPLVYYPGTPFEWQKRNTSEISWKGERYFNDEMYEKNKEAGISIKINGFRGSTFIEQALVDLGGSMTEWVYNNIVVPGTVCYNTRPVADPKIYQSFKNLITAPDKYFGARDMDCYISPEHRIRPSLEGGYIAAARKLEKDMFSSEPTGKCLYTYEGCKTLCHKNAIKSRPYIKYKDVRIEEDEKGNRHMVGTEPEEIPGCEYCESPEEMKNKHLKRPWRHKYSVDDLQAQVVTRSQVKYRFILKRNEEYSLVSPHNTAYTAIACLLRKSDKILNAYWEIKDHSLFHQTDPELVYDISGIQIVDCIFKEDVLDEVKLKLKEANKELRASQFVDVVEIPLDEKMSVDDYNVYTFTAKGIPTEEFINGKALYKGGVRVLSKVDMQSRVVKQEDKNLSYPLFKRTQEGIKGVFILPRRYNPYLFFQEVLSEKKYTQKQLQQKVAFKVVTVLQEESYTSDKCGKPICRSAITGKALGKCKDCVARTLLHELK